MRPEEEIEAKLARIQERHAILDRLNGLTGQAREVSHAFVDYQVHELMWVLGSDETEFKPLLFGCNKCGIIHAKQECPICHGKIVIDALH